MAVPISRQTLTNALLMTLNVTGSICSTGCAVTMAKPHFWEIGHQGRCLYWPFGRLLLNSSEIDRHHPDGAHLQLLTGVDDSRRADLLHDQGAGRGKPG